MQSLSYGDTPTGVMFGFLKYIPTLCELFNTPHLVFCWDSKTNKRFKIYKQYKSNRHPKKDTRTRAELLFESEFRIQMARLRRVYLPKIGFKNVFLQKGYESDDIMASVSKHLPKGDKAIIISSDQDLYQLITTQTTFYNPITCKQLTKNGFISKYDIKPREWWMMKAIAGCSSDGVPGVYRVGEKTAIKYLKGELNDMSVAYGDITSINGKKIYVRNRKLVKLPFKGTKIFKLRPDDVSQKGWNEVMDMLGMKSIKGRAPILDDYGRVKRSKRKIKKKGL